MAYSFVMTRLGPVGISRAGDEAQIREFVDQHWDLLYRCAYFICADRWIAEDIAQEAMIKALAGLQSFDQSRPLEPWLSAIAANAAKDWLRSRSRRPEAPLEETSLELAHGDVEAPFGAEVLPDDLARELLKLDLPLRAAVVMRHLLGLSTAEIADLFEVAPVTIRTRLHRGLSQLRQALATKEVSDV